MRRQKPTHLLLSRTKSFCLISSTGELRSPDPPPILFEKLTFVIADRAPVFYYHAHAHAKRRARAHV